jgi:hypothetical protein
MKNQARKRKESLGGSSFVGETAPKSNAPWVTATEIAGYAYCPEAWRLTYGLGRKGGKLAEKAKGTRSHTRWERAEKTSSKLLRFGLLLLLLTVLAAIIEALF